MSARRGATTRDRRRVVVLGLAAVSLAGLAAVTASSSGALAPVVAKSVAQVNLDAESSAFYCGGLEHVQGVVESYVAVADLASTPRIVEITTTNEREQVALRQVKVRPGHVFHFTPARLLDGSLEAATVEANLGGIAATESIRGVNGVAVAPCLSSTSTDSWLTGGSTQTGADLVLSIFNPYASQAVVNVLLQSPSGISRPPSFQGLVLGPHQLAALNVHAVAPNQSPITADVAASDGSVVVYGIERSTTGGPLVSLLPGSPPSTGIELPSGAAVPGRTTQLLVVDTGAAPVAASVQALTPSCTKRCTAPFVVDLAPGLASTLTISPSLKVLSGSSFGAVVTAPSPGVIVALRVRASGATGQSTPLDDPGLAGATHLVVVNPLANGFNVVDVLNPTSSAVRVRLETVGPSGETSIGRAFGLGPHGVARLGPSALRGVVDGVLELVATGPIAAAGVVNGAQVGAGTLVAVPTTRSG